MPESATKRVKRAENLAEVQSLAWQFDSIVGAAENGADAKARKQALQAESEAHGFPDHSLAPVFIMAAKPYTDSHGNEAAARTAMGMIYEAAMRESTVLKGYPINTYSTNAGAEYRASLMIDPSDRATLVIYTGFLLSRAEQETEDMARDGYYEEAEKCVARLHYINGGRLDARALTTLAHIYKGLERDNLAQACLEQALEKTTEERERRTIEGALGDRLEMLGPASTDDHDEVGQRLVAGARNFITSFHVRAEPAPHRD